MHFRRAKSKAIGALTAYNQFEDEAAAPQPKAASPPPQQFIPEPEVHFYPLNLAVPVHKLRLRAWDLGIRHVSTPMTRRASG